MREARGELRQGQGGHREATASVNQRVSSALLNMAPEQNWKQNITFNPCSLLMSSSRRDRDEEANQWQGGKDDDEDQERLGVEVLRYVGQGREVEVARRPIGPNLLSGASNVDQQSRDQTDLLEEEGDVDEMSNNMLHHINRKASTWNRKPTAFA